MPSESEPSIDTDRALVTAFIRRRDEGAFRLLYRRHTPSLYLLARRILGGSPGAEDAIQEAWLRAAGRFASFRWESSLRTWLSGIVVNRCREILRETDRSGWITTGDLMKETGSSPVVERRLDLARAISRLPSGCRGVMVMHDIEGMTHAEIATMLGIDEGTSRSQLHKARRALRGMLCAGDPPPVEGVRDDA